MSESVVHTNPECTRNFLTFWDAAGVRRCTGCEPAERPGPRPPSEEFLRDRALVESMVGRSIVRAEWEDSDPDHDWTGHEMATLWLDDGRVIKFHAWGYDAWGATVSVRDQGEEVPF